jgi:NDP-sugar pyrophosphorylase family protein
MQHREEVILLCGSQFRSDPFILISGDVISNMNLQDVMKFHRERRATDNCCKQSHSSLKFTLKETFMISRNEL